MKVIVFDISGDFGYFRMPEGTRSSYTFPFPPRTAVFGMIGAILGRDSNSYWGDNDSFASLKVGLQMLNPIQLYPMKMNYWRSKSTVSLGRSSGIKFILPSDAKSRGFTTQMKLQFLKDPKFRIIVTGDDEVYHQLKSHLVEHTSIYPLSLGHVNLLAEISYVGEFTAESISEGRFSSIIYSDILDNESISLMAIGAGFSIYRGVPHSYSVFEKEVDKLIYLVNEAKKYSNVLLPNFNDTIPLIVKDGYGIRLEIDNKKEEIALF